MNLLGKGIRTLNDYPEKDTPITRYLLTVAAVGAVMILAVNLFRWIVK